MSIAALKWAWSQQVPYKPKFVLVTLADQTDETTGRVCYQRTDVSFFVDKCGMPERSFYRCIAALVRQGYMARETKRGPGASPSYWLKLDRNPTELEDWTWSATELDETQDIEDENGVPATMAETNPESPCHGGHESLPLVAEHRDSLELPKNQKPLGEKPTKGFSRSAQHLDRKAVQASVVDIGEMPGYTYVIEGTRWWALLMAHRRKIGRPINRTDPGIGKYKGRTGRYIKTDEWNEILKSPSTAPPQTDTMSADDQQYLAQTGLR